MSSIAKLANGTLLKVGDGASSEVFTTVPEVYRLRGPSTRFDILDVSSHDTVGLYREFIPGMADGDVVAAELHWRPSNAVHVALRVAADAGTLRNIRMVFPDTSLNTVNLSTFINQGIAPEANVAEVLKSSVQFKVNGAPTWS
jgi:predicted secreted protein